jgi:hypothetical protein
MKTDIYAVRFALITVFIFKNEIFISTLRAFYKNAQIFTTVRLALTPFLELICFKNYGGTVRAFEINQSKR